MRCGRQQRRQNTSSPAVTRESGHARSDSRPSLISCGGPRMLSASGRAYRVPQYLLFSGLPSDKAWASGENKAWASGENKSG